MTKIRCIVKWLLPFKRVEQLATFGLAGLQAVSVLSGHEQTADEAAQEGQGSRYDVEHKIKLTDEPEVRCDVGQGGLRLRTPDSRAVEGDASARVNVDAAAVVEDEVNLRAQREGHRSVVGYS